MSSDTSSSASGQCIVCGKTPCYTRCSACLANGTDYIYFCSTEHQRLVWFLHKQVCGIRSSPFRVPALSSEEIEEYQTLLHKPFFVAEGGTGTWMELLKENKRIPEGLWRFGISDETVVTAYLKQLQESETHPLLAPSDLRELLATRALVYCARQGIAKLPILEDRALIAKHPFDWIAHVQSRRIAQTGNFTQPPWVNEAFHRYTSHIAILARIYKDRGTLPEIGHLVTPSSSSLSQHLSLLGCTGTPEALELKRFMFDELHDMVAVTAEVIARRKKPDDESQDASEAGPAEREKII